MKKPPSVEWLYLPFTDLSIHDVHDILKLRQDIFVVEQDCAFHDIDGRDPFCDHLLARLVDGKAAESLVAYLRIVPPGKYFTEIALGSIITAQSVRGSGIGTLLIEKGIDLVEEVYGPSDIRISAQAHLETYYNKFGFLKAGDPFDEDGIMHIEMLRAAR